MTETKASEVLRLAKAGRKNVEGVSPEGLGRAFVYALRAGYDWDIGIALAELDEVGKVEVSEIEITKPVIWKCDGTLSDWRPGQA